MKAPWTEQALTNVGIALWWHCDPLLITTRPVGENPWILPRKGRLKKEKGHGSMATLFISLSGLSSADTARLFPKRYDLTGSCFQILFKAQISPQDYNIYEITLYSDMCYSDKINTNNQCNFINFFPSNIFHIANAHQREWGEKNVLFFKHL